MILDDYKLRIRHSMLKAGSEELIRALTLSDIGSAVILERALEAVKKIDPMYAAGDPDLTYFLADIDLLGLHDNKAAILFHDVCGHDINKMVYVLRAHDLKIVSRDEIQKAIWIGEKHSLNVGGIIRQVRANIAWRAKAALIPAQREGNVLPFRHPSQDPGQRPL